MPRENSFSDDGRSLTPDLELPEEAPPHSSPHPVEKLPVLSTAPRRSTMRSPAHPTPTATGHITPKDRFRAAVRKVIQLHRIFSVTPDPATIGAEPGINPRNQSAYLIHGHIRQKCEIEVVDYSGVRNSARQMSNSDFVKMMNMGLHERQPWSKVRWINIGGISWDVMSALAIKYDIHPLALEGVLTNRGHARSKADYYAQHLYLRVLCHTVMSDDEIADSYGAHITDHPRATSPVPMTPQYEKPLKEKDSDDEATVYGASALQSRFSTRYRKLDGGGELVGDAESTAATAQSFISKTFSRRSTAPPIRAQWEEGNAVGALKQGERVNVKIAPMHIFLRPDGTVITIHPTPNLLFTAPITDRLRQRNTMLRVTADPSLLVQSLLDLIVDSALHVVDEYQGKLLTLEQAILLKPKMSTVRHLHVMSGDLILHKRTLGPIKTLVYGLRRYDLDRCAALIDISKTDPTTGAPNKIKGYMSQKAITYLADVMDHMEHVLASLDMFEAVAENLINFTFNTVSSDMNEAMRRLMMATIIFLPLTLLTGYFGMNFQHMWSTKDNNHSDIIYWEIAIPLMIVVIACFLYRDIIRMVHYLKKRTFLRMLDMS